MQNYIFGCHVINVLFILLIFKLNVKFRKQMSSYLISKEACLHQKFWFIFKYTYFKTTSMC